MVNPNGVKLKYLAMGTWKTKEIQKKNRGSHTPGKLKVDSCRTDSDKQFFAKRSRSYKDIGYSQWCKQMDALNGRKKHG